MGGAQYCGGVQYHGDIMSTVGDILSTVGVQYHGGYHDKHGDIMSTLGSVQYCGGYHPLKFEYLGGYHDYRRGVQYHGVLK